MKVICGACGQERDAYPGAMHICSGEPPVITHEGFDMLVQAAMERANCGDYKYALINLIAAVVALEAQTNKRFMDAQPNLDEMMRLASSAHAAAYPQGQGR